MKKKAYTITEDKVVEMRRREDKTREDRKKQ
jgi:hypothetical protein